MKKYLWAAALVIPALAGVARAQQPAPPFTLDTGLAPHFHFNKKGMPIFGPYKESTLPDLPGGVPRHPKPIPWYLYYPVHASRQPIAPMPYPYWPTMPPADGNGQPMMPPPGEGGMGMMMQPGMMPGQGYPPGMTGMPGQGWAPGMTVQQMNPMMQPPGMMMQPPMMQSPGMLPPGFQGGGMMQQPGMPMLPTPR